MVRGEWRSREEFQSFAMMGARVLSLGAGLNPFCPLASDKNSCLRRERAREREWSLGVGRQAAERIPVDSCVAARRLRCAARSEIINRSAAFKNPADGSTADATLSEGGVGQKEKPMFATGCNRMLSMLSATVYSCP